MQHPSLVGQRDLPRGGGKVFDIYRAPDAVGEQRPVAGAVRQGVHRALMLDWPCPKMSEVRATAAPGIACRTAVPAAAFAAPYG